MCFSRQTENAALLYIFLQILSWDWLHCGRYQGESCCRGCKQILCHAFFNSSHATKLVPRRHKSWLGWKPVVCQFTLWCPYSSGLNLSLYESKSWLCFKSLNASLLLLTKLTSVPPDVALIINLGVYSDALMIMKQSRTRLVRTSCASHRLELLLKDAVKDSGKFYTTISPYLRILAKLKRMKKILHQYIIFLIIFCAKYMVSQYTKVWHGWPVLTTGFENIPANNWGSSREGRSKIQEILK